MYPCRIIPESEYKCSALKSTRKRVSVLSFDKAVFLTRRQCIEELKNALLDELQIYQWGSTTYRIF